MAGKKAKVSSRKIKDKWKVKEWYKVHAPLMFNESEIGETPAIDPDTLYGRVVEVTVNELTGDFSKQHIKIKFQITNIDGYDAKTSFIGHEITSDYVRRLTRRRKTKTDHVVDITTKDGFVLRLKPMSVAERRIQTSQEDAMRRCMVESLTQIGMENNLSDIVKIIVSGDMAKIVAKACHEVIPIKRIEIRKSEVLEVGEGEPESIMSAFEPMEEPVVEPEEITEDEPEPSTEEHEVETPVETDL